MKKKVLVVVFGFLLILAACGGGDDTDGGGDSAGEKLYANNCAVCHGGNLQGGGGPKLTGLSSKYSSEDIQEIIKNGKGSMPPVNMSEEDAKTLADWILEQ